MKWGQIAATKRVYRQRFSHKKQYMDYFIVKSTSRMKSLEASSSKYVSAIQLKIEEKKKKQAIDSDL